MHYSSEYSYELTSTLQNGALTFSSQKDNKTKEKSVDWTVTGKLDGRFFVRPEVSVKFAYALGGGLWLEPFVSAELEYPWATAQDDLFFGIEGGCSLKVAWYDYYSPDLLGLTPEGFDLFGPTGTAGNTPPTAIATNVTASQSTNPVQLEAFDADGDPLVYYLVTHPTNGLLSTLNSQNGQITYTPDWKYFGPDSFQFKVWDGTDYSLPATVSITVAPGSPPHAHFIATNPVFMMGHFDATASWDAETPKSNLTYRWDFENDGVWDTGFQSSEVIDHAFPSQGTKTVKLLVKDSDGVTSASIQTVDVTFIPGSAQMTAMAFIPAGSFEMGRHVGTAEFDELPLHSITLNAFYMDMLETTNESYAEYLNDAYSQGLIYVTNGVVIGTSNSMPYFDTNSASNYSRIDWNGQVFSIKPGKLDHPLSNVSWFGSVAFANWRSSRDSLIPCYDLTNWSCDFGATGYRLPTEAEWEYAARGQQPASYYQYPWGNSINGSNANYSNSGDPFESGPQPYTTPVGYYNGSQVPTGSNMANGFGLYDTSGNVSEWCGDWFGSGFYASSPFDNPTGPTTGATRVVRGGRWNYNAYLASAANRSTRSPDNRTFDIGFRLVKAASK